MTGAGPMGSLASESPRRALSVEHPLGAAWLLPPLLASAWFAGTSIDGALRGMIPVGGRWHAVIGDDMMISLRYAYHLAHGHGLVWNPGEYVQGITNLGWTLLLALPYALGAPLATAPLAVKGVNVLMQVALAWGLFAWSWRRGRPLEATVTGTVVALDANLAAWGVGGGHETTLQAILITAALLSLRGNPLTAPIWAALAVVVRPDALVIFAVVGAWLLGRRCWSSMAAVVAGGSLIAAVLVGQRLYYGDWLPNTFALKATQGSVSLLRGLDYVGGFAFGEFLSLPLLAAPALWVGWRWALGQSTGRLLPVVAAVYAWTAYVVVMGGDAFRWGRFFAPIVPVMALCAGALLEDAIRAPAGRRRWAAGVLGIAMALGLGVHVVRSLPVAAAASKPHETVYAGVCIAAALRDRLPPTAVVGVYFAGLIPYLRPDVRFHDFLGKSDRHIARTRAHAGHPGHNKWDYAYSLGIVKPDLLITAGPFPDTTDAPYEAALKADDAFHPALWLDPLFRSRYRAHRLLGPESRWPFWVYARPGFDMRPLELPGGVCRHGA